MTIKDYQLIFHEIKNNITFISSSLQLVEKAHPEIKEFPYWKDSMEEVSALKRMLVELSSARLIDDLNKQDTSLDMFLSDFAASCTAAFDSSMFHIQISLETSLPDISIDSDRLKRALFNLVKNSYEAMDGSGTVRLTGSREDTCIRLDLSDNGGGIPADYLPRLFTPFTTTKPGGSGLGLLITRQIIEAHGGRITVESVPGEGCTFSVYLPILNSAYPK